MTDVYAVDVDRIDLDHAMTIYNYDNVDAIYTNDNNLTIINYQTINAVYNTGTSYVLQQIPDNAALNTINMHGNNFHVQINNVNSADVRLVQRIVEGAEEVRITDSSLVIDDFADWRNWNQTVLLEGTNTLYIKHPETVVSGERIQFIKNNGTKVVLLDSDQLYKVTLRYDSGASFIDITKTDVSNIFDDERGEILKDLQLSGSNSSLLLALNNAKSMQEINQIMQSSYRFNPSILMRPVSTLNQFYLLDLLNNENSLYGGFSGFYIGSDATDAFGFNLHFGGKYEDWRLSTTLYWNRFYYQKDVNNFDGFSYGGNIKIKRYIDSFWIHGIAGLSFANFKTDTIYHNNMIKRNPFGYSGYGALDIGYDYNIIDDLSIAPFGGVLTQISSVMKSTNTDSTIRFGGNIKYSLATDGLKYEYSGAAGATIVGDLFGNFGVGFVSEQDGAGVSIDLSFLNNDDSFHYKISLNGKILF